jgi:hypothetical protein
LVGYFDPRHLIDCRAIKSSFTPGEFRLLARLIEEFTVIVATPHILTEVSNLAGRLPQELHTQFRSFFATVIPRLSEQHVPGPNIAKAEAFVRFGITDTAITMIAPGQFVVLTEEAALFGYLQKRGVAAINFNHIRLAA